MMLHFKAPHHSYEYPERWKDYLKDTLIPEPPSLHEDVEKTSPRLKGVHTWHMIHKNGYFGRHEKDEVPPGAPVSHTSNEEAYFRSTNHLKASYTSSRPLGKHSDEDKKYGISEDIEVDTNGLAHASDKVGIGAEIDFAMIEKMKAAELS
jgi:hypothetical protein